MEFSTDRSKIAEWAPLVVNGRDENQSIAANYSAEGTDVDFGSLTRQMVKYLSDKGVKSNSTVMSTTSTANRTAHGC